MRISLALIVFLMASFASATVNAQCADRLPGPSEPDTLIVALPTPSPSPATQYTHVRATLHNNVRFKVILDHDLTGGFNKTNDYVAFSLLEDVYGLGVIPDTRLKRCVIIPKGTKIYGTIDHANSRYPFSIGGKGKLFVTVNELKLDNGHDNDGILVPIRFVSHTGTHATDIVRPCKHANQNCIVGRRAKLKVSASAIGAGAAAGLLLVKNSNDDDPSDAIGGIAALSFLEALSKSTGIDDIVNPSDAILKEKLVFDVETTSISANNPLRVWVALAPKKEEKEKFCCEKSK